jgi:hypothetical protein
MSKIVLLIHGPFSDYAINSLAKYEKLFHQVVISGYKADESDWQPFAKSRTLVLSEDVINPGPWNVNRQLNLVSAGLREIDPDAMVLKLRSDQRVHLRKVTKYLEKHLEVFKGTSKYFSTNCFTRIDRLYHPSDMFIAGSQSTLAKLFGISQSQSTQLDAEILVRRLMERGEDPNLAYLWPESYIFTKYLAENHWDVLGTYEDSKNALARYVIIANSFSIRLRWEKKALHFVFPFTATKYPPFFGGPLEDAVCARATNPANRFSEFFFWTTAKIDTFIWVRTSPKKITREFLIKIRMKFARIIVAWTPPILLNALLRSFIYRWFKSLEAQIAKKF